MATSSAPSWSRPTRHWEVELWPDNRGVWWYSFWPCHLKCCSCGLRNWMFCSCLLRLLACSFPWHFDLGGYANWLSPCHLVCCSWGNWRICSNYSHVVFLAFWLMIGCANCAIMERQILFQNVCHCVESICRFITSFFKIPIGQIAGSKSQQNLGLQIRFWNSVIFHNSRTHLWHVFCQLAPNWNQYVTQLLDGFCI
jgi:hypothetical protein